MNAIDCPFRDLGEGLPARPWPLLRHEEEGMKCHRPEPAPTEEDDDEDDDADDRGSSGGNIDPDDDEGDLDDDEDDDEAETLWT